MLDLFGIIATCNQSLILNFRTRIEKDDIIIGKIVYVPLEGGFYGIEGVDGQEWYPIDLPDSFKEKGLEVVVQAVESPDTFSLAMWGTPIKILTIFSEKA